MRDTEAADAPKKENSPEFKATEKVVSCAIATWYSNTANNTTIVLFMSLFLIDLCQEQAQLSGHPKILYQAQFYIKL